MSACKKNGQTVVLFEKGTTKTPSVVPFKKGTTKTRTVIPFEKVTAKTRTAVPFEKGTTKTQTAVPFEKRNNRNDKNAHKCCSFRKGTAKYTTIKCKHAKNELAVHCIDAEDGSQFE